jgi:hypothetical protein
MTHGEEGKNTVALEVDEVGLISGEPSPLGAEKPRGFFSASGAPGPGARDEKPGGLFITTSPGEAALSQQSVVPAEELLTGLVPAPWSLGGRPRVLTDEVRAEVCKLLAVGMSRRQAAAYLDIDATTISHAAKRDPDFARNLKRAEELGTVQPLMALMAASRRNWRAAAWFLKHRKEGMERMTPEDHEEHHQHMLRQEVRRSELSRLESKLLEEEREEEEARQKAKEERERAERNAEMFPRRRKKQAEQEK